MYYALKKNEDKKLVPSFLEEKINESNFAFNPSLVKHDQTSYLAIRIFTEVPENRIESHLYIWQNKHDLINLNLSAFFLKEAGIKKVADPKLFLMGGSVWGTFNTGYTARENNKIFIFKIEGTEILEWFECSYLDRNRVEKNWSFIQEDSDIYALYGLNPVTFLKCTSTSENFMHFEQSRIVKSLDFAGYTIGTPLFNHEGIYYFVSHKKLFFNGKRIYFGRLFSLDFNNMDIKKESKILIHSLYSLLGNRHKFNVNLISCSYFSGIYMHQNQMYLTYGVNDTSWHIAKIKDYKKWL